MSSPTTQYVCKEAVWFLLLIARARCPRQRGEHLARAIVEINTFNYNVKICYSCKKIDPINSCKTYKISTLFFVKFIFSDNGIVYCFWHFSIWHNQDACASVGFCFYLNFKKAKTTLLIHYPLNTLN